MSKTTSRNHPYLRDCGHGPPHKMNSSKQTTQYDQAVKELIDLRDLAVRDGHIEQFQAHFPDLVRRHERKYAFVKRLRKAGLMT